MKKKKSKSNAARDKTERTAGKRAANGLHAEVKRLAAHMHAVHSNVLDVGFSLRELHEVAQATAGTPGTVTTDGAPSVQIKFKKRKGSPANVRILLLDTTPPEEVLSPNQDEGTATRPVGDRFNALMQVSGNFGEVATVDIEKALPVFMSMTAFPGTTGNAGTKPMKVTG